jgi:hypothetical protein
MQEKDVNGFHIGSMKSVMYQRFASCVERYATDRVRSSHVVSGVRTAQQTRTTAVPFPDAATSA